MIWILLLAVLLLLLILCPFVLVRCVRSSNEDMGEKVLLVIAHPDDECLFFGPFLLSVRSTTFVLCLSNGHNERAEELRRSCVRLRVKAMKIIDDQIHLKDSQSLSWSSSAIVGHVRQAMNTWKINTLISFDDHGISEHRNHTSIYFALYQLCTENHIPLFTLQSLPIYRKYITLMEFLRMFINRSNTMTFVVPWRDTFSVHRAMFEHRSQLVWFRYLYLLFSRYIWINDLRRVVWKYSTESSAFLLSFIDGTVRGRWTSNARRV